MEGNTVKLMNEFLREFLVDLKITNSELVEVKNLVVDNQTEAINVMILIIYMYKKAWKSRDEIYRELVDELMSKLIKFDLKQGDEKYFNVIKE